MEEKEEAIAVEIIIKIKTNNPRYRYKVNWRKRGYDINNSVLLPARSQSALQIIYPFELQPPLGRAK